MPPVCLQMPPGSFPDAPRCLPDPPKASNFIEFPQISKNPNWIKIVVSWWTYYSFYESHLIAINKIIDKAKELESKMKESQEKIKNIQVEGTSGSNSVKVTLNGENEMIKIDLSDEILKENKIIIEDLIVAAHNNAKSELKSKTSEEISKSTSGFGIPGFKWPL